MGTSTGGLPDPVAGRAGTKRWNVLRMSAERWPNKLFKFNSQTHRTYFERLFKTRVVAVENS